MLRDEKEKSLLRQNYIEDFFWRGVLVTCSIIAVAVFALAVDVAVVVENLAVANAKGK